MYYMCQLRYTVHPLLHICLNQGDGCACLVRLKYSVLTAFFLNWQRVMYTSSSHFFTPTSYYRIQMVTFFLADLNSSISISKQCFIPRFSLSNHVRTESLYGMKSVFFFFLLCSKK